MLNTVSDFIAMNMIYLVHVLFVGPLLVYTATAKNCENRKNLNNLLLFLGLGVMVYHSYKIYLYNFAI